MVDVSLHGNDVIVVGDVCRYNPILASMMLNHCRAQLLNLFQQLQMGRRAPYNSSG
jgi:hypothetical protein